MMLITAFTYLGMVLDFLHTIRDIVISGVTEKAILWTPLLTLIRLTDTYIS